MIPLYTQAEYNAAQTKDLLLCECEYCHQPFHKIKHDIVKHLRGHMKRGSVKYCSKKCSDLARITQESVTCLNCASTFYRTKNQITKYKHHFCSQSCAAKYNNTHKTTGTRRSKLEVYLEKELTKLYSNMEIHFNRTDAINAELDIYIPSLKLAFELNGIFHYEPIFGAEKFQRTQTNDKRKFQACLEQKIELCIIDVSSMHYFKEQKATPYLHIITQIINTKISKN